MNEQVFEIITLILRAILIAVTVFIVPRVKKWIDANTTAKQREDAVFWTRIVVKAAEGIYKERGQGKFKKSYVIDWLKENGIKVSASQMDELIREIVEEFNKHGWDKVVTEIEAK